MEDEQQNAPAPSSEPAAAHVFYTGRVQGVGFRATATWIARTHPVTGWVKNLEDGRVELHAEGTRFAVETFLNTIGLRFAGKIKNEAVDWMPATGAYTSFDVIPGA